MRAERLMRLTALLQRHRKLGAAELAWRLGVSERTVRRDIGALSAVGIPVYTEPGRGGGCAILGTFRTETSGLTTAEARALFGWAGRDGADDLGISPELTGALAKIAAGMGDSAATAAQSNSTIVHSDRRRWFTPPDEVPHLPTLRDAALRSKRLRLQYTPSGAARPRTRTVDPWGVVDHSGRWYLVAAHRGAARIYRVSRITSSRVIDDRARLPDDRTLAQVWADLRARFEMPPGSMGVELLVDQDAADEVRGPFRTLLVDDQLDEQVTGDGRLRWRATVRHRRRIVGFALTWADVAELTSPPEGIAAVRRAIAMASRRYPNRNPEVI
ncbi:MAG: helix-turn-helix transcriptional regulator [Beutenbergiaceae bacterium]